MIIWYLTFLYFLLYGGTYWWGLGCTSQLINHFFIYIFIGFIIFKLIKSSKNFSLGSSINIFTTLLIIITFLVTIFSTNLRNSIESLLFVLFYILLFYSIVNWLKKNTNNTFKLLRLITITSFIFFLITIIFYLFKFKNIGNFVFPQTNTLFLPLGHYNFTASLFIMLNPIVFVNFLKESNKYMKYLSFFCFLCLYFTIPNIGSRIAYFAFICQLLLTLLILIFIYKNKIISFISQNKKYIIFSGILIVTFFLITQIFFKAGKERTISLFSLFNQIITGNISDVSLISHLNIWKSSIIGCLQHPLLGIGWNTTSLQFQTHRIQTPDFTNTIIPHLHNTYLTILYEGGILSFILLLSVCFCIIYKFYKNFRVNNINIIYIGTSISLFGYSITLITDFHMFLPSMCITFIIILSLMIKTGFKLHDLEQKNPKIFNTFLVTTLFIFLIFNIYFFARIDYAYFNYEKGINLLKQKNYKKAINNFKKASLFDNYIFYKFFLGTILTTQNNINDLMESKKLLIEATKKCKLSFIYFKAGIVSLSLNDFQNAEYFLKESSNLDYYLGSSHYALGELYRIQNLQDKAILEYAKAIEFSPILLHSILWDKEKYLASKVYTQVLKDYNQLLTIYPQDYEIYQRLAVIKIKQQKLNESIKYLQKALTINKKHTKSIFYIGYVYFLQQNFKQAQTMFEKTLNLEPENKPALFYYYKLLNIKGENDKKIYFNQLLNILKKDYINAEKLILDFDKNKIISLKIDFLPRIGELVFKRFSPDIFYNKINFHPIALLYTDEIFPVKSLPPINYNKIIHLTMK